MKTRHLLITSCLALAISGSAHAATVIVDSTTLNGSFETPDVPVSPGWQDYGYAGETVENWTLWSSSFAVGNGFFQNGAAQDGGQFAGLQGAGSSTLYMDAGTVNVTCAANTTYTLTAYARLNSSEGTGNAGAISIYARDGSWGYYQQATTNLTGLSTTWQQFTVSFTTGASGGAVGQALQFDLGRTGGDNQLWFDNVVVTSIPEPHAALLGGLGMFALLRRRR